MSLNLQSQYYSTTRDFALLENDPVDIAAIQASFNADYAAEPPVRSAGASDFSYQPVPAMTSSGAPQLRSRYARNHQRPPRRCRLKRRDGAATCQPLVAACTRGVTVHIAMEYSSSYVSTSAP